MEKQYVVFRLEGQIYGADIAVVREVNQLTRITRLPNTPHYVDGVIDLRGEVMPVVNLRKRLGLMDVEPDKETRVMILDLGQQSCALIVDGVDQVVTLSDEQIVPPDRRATMVGQDYVVGVARTGSDQLVIIMDLVKLMDPAFA